MFNSKVKVSLLFGEFFSVSRDQIQSVFHFRDQKNISKLLPVVQFYLHKHKVDFKL